MTRTRDDARVSKEQQERRERRLRGGDMDGWRKNLTLSEGEKRPGMALRWSKDDGKTIQGRTTGTGDWEVDPDVAPRHAGINPRTNEPMTYRLLYKPQDWLDEDMAKRREARESAIRRQAPIAKGEFEQDGSQMYSPGGAIRTQTAKVPTPS